jgi:hypothetical protein
MVSELGQQLIEIVRRKAAEQPDFFYLPPPREDGGEGETCLYVHPDGTPGCIIGQALLEAGVIDASFHTRGADNERAFPELAVDVLDLPLDAEERAWLSQVQRQQDGKCSWGWSVSRADQVD